MPDAPVLETVETTAPPPTGDEHTNGLTDSADILALMRDGLKETNPTLAAEAEGESVAGDETPKPEASEADAPKTQPGSRRGRTVEKVMSAAEQRIADAEARATAAEAKAAELEAKVTEATTAPTVEQARLANEKLRAEHTTWRGSDEEYAEALRLSRMDPDAEGWDWEAHKKAVNNLETWDDRRKWEGILVPSGESMGESRAFASIEKDFVETLSADLPEDKRDGYRKHPGGIPGAVRFYAEAIAAPKIEALEATIAEKDAEIERLLTTGGGYRSPSPGGSNGASSNTVDMRGWSPEQMMSHELALQAKASRGRR